MKYVEMRLEVELSDNYTERTVDETVREAICHYGGQVLNSQEFRSLSKNEVNK